MPSTVPLYSGRCVRLEPNLDVNMYFAPSCCHLLMLGDKQTYQAEDHLVEHRSQTPPVHCPVVRLLTQNLWCQVLQIK